MVVLVNSVHIYQLVLFQLKTFDFNKQKTNLFIVRRNERLTNIKQKENFLNYLLQNNRYVV